MRKLIVVKHSKYEWERKTLNLTHDELVAKYSKERANLSAILNSHEQQLSTREKFRTNFPRSKFVMMDEITSDIERFDLVLVLGGDNSFTNISHFVRNIPILGINSDPDRSVGSLTRWAIHDDEDISVLYKLLDTYSFDVEEWPRLEAMLDGNKIVPATSEFFFGEKLRNMMSRHVLVYRGKEYEQKSSGIIVATGAGSTGWYRSICGGRGAWAPTLNVASFVVSEPYGESADSVYSGELGGHEILTLYSLNDDQGIASSDSWDYYPFNRGSEVSIHLGCPLNVVTLRREQR